MESRPALDGFPKSRIQPHEDDVDVLVGERARGRPRQVGPPGRPDAPQIASGLVLQIHLEPVKGRTGDLKEKPTEVDDRRLCIRGHSSFGGSWRSD